MPYPFSKQIHPFLLTRRLTALCAWCLCLGFTLYGDTALALESDRQQPIEIIADQAELDEGQGVAHYTGKVVLTQGSLIINADDLYIRADNNKQVQQVTAKGSPAVFTQTPEPDQPPVTAKAKTIDYYVSDEKLILQLDAIVVQNESTFQGTRIQYDIRTRRMQATGGDAKNAVKGGNQRVKMVLPPSQPDDKQGKSKAPKSGAKP
ncbi:OstA-like protein [gamma proteobacterium HdN1]|nr:OstA-like protein [gamma proteobacterium HdN1]